MKTRFLSTKTIAPIVLFFLFQFSSQNLKAQDCFNPLSPCGVVIADDNCSTAAQRFPSICELEGFRTCTGDPNNTTGVTELSTEAGSIDDIIGPGWCGNNSGVPTNNLWIAFVPESSPVEFFFRDMDCGEPSTFGLDGIQAVIIRTDDCVTAPPDFMGGLPNNPAVYPGCPGCQSLDFTLSVSIAAADLGQLHFIMVDGCLVDNCAFTMDVISGFPPPPDYSVTLVSDGLCGNDSGPEDDALITAIVNPELPFPLSYIYEWYKDGVLIDGVDTRSITADDLGAVYSVVVRDPTNCCSPEPQSYSLVLATEVPTAQLNTTDFVLNCNNEDTGIVLDATPMTPNEGNGYYWGWYQYVNGQLTPHPDGANPIIPGNNYETLTVIEPGFYYFRIDNREGGCFEELEVVITEDFSAPQANAGTDVEITCGSIDTVTLEGNGFPASTGGAITFEWFDAGGVAGGLIPGTGVTQTQNLSSTTPGIYTLVVTSDNNGCTAMDEAEITSGDLVQEVTIDGDAIQTINCLNIDNGGLTLTATLATADSTVTYAWTNAGGTNIIGTTSPSVTVLAAGIYTVQTTNTDGCVAIAVVEVIEDTTPPTADAGMDVIVNCGDPFPELTSTASDANGSMIVSRIWYDATGANVSNTPTYTPTTAGIYTVVVTNLNGCTDEAMVTVTIDDIESDLTIEAEVVGIITCDNNLVEIIASSNTDNVIYAWTGPNGFTSNNPNEVVDLVGIYNLTVTLDNTDCPASTTTSVAVIENIVPPTVNAGSDVLLDDCDNIEVVLNGDDSGTGLSYEWTGDNITSNTDSLQVTVGATGTYTLTVTADNGCTSSDLVEVICDEDAYCDNLTVWGFVEGILSSENATTRISALSSYGLGVTYSWTGPNGFTSNERTTKVSEPGFYTVKITSTLDGCTAENTVEVFLRSASPGLHKQDLFLKNNASSFMEVYPNPSNGEFFINANFSKKEKVNNIYVHNQMGCLLHHQYFNNQEDLERIDLRNLSPGTYILTVKGIDTTSSKKIIIQ